MKILAVASCPMGIAHTYMASAALKKAAKKAGYKIKVETQGSMGIRDKISKKDLEEGLVLILATDVVTLEQERFEGFPTYKISTSKVIRNGDAAIEAALALIKN